MTGRSPVRVDAHHHLWSLADRDHDWLGGPTMSPIRRDYTVEDLERVTSSAGIDRTVLVQVLPDRDETAGFLALAARNPLIAGVVGWADLSAPTIADDLRELTAAPGGDRLVGIRHLVQAEPDPRWLTRPDVLRGLRAVAAAGLSYDILVLPHQLPAATAAVRAVPMLRFVLDHLAKPPIAAGEREPWASALRELAAEPNVTAKVSGLVTEADHRGWRPEDLEPYVGVALDAFGPERIMAGSDWPVCLLAADYGQVFATTEALLGGLSRTERADVFGGTACRVYGLEPGT